MTAFDDARATLDAEYERSGPYARRCGLARLPPELARLPPELADYDGSKRADWLAGWACADREIKERTKAVEDARLFGTGFYLVKAGGDVTRVDPEMVTIATSAHVDGRNIIRGEMDIVRMPDGRTLAEVLAENERLRAFVATVRGALP